MSTMRQLSFDGFGDLPTASKNEHAALSGVLKRIEQHLENSRCWGLLSSEEVLSLCYLLLRLLDGQEDEAKDALVSHIVGQPVKAKHLSIGDQPVHRLLKMVLERPLRQQPESREDARIAEASAKQIAQGFREVRDALESHYIHTGGGSGMRVVSSELLSYFPNFSRLVYGTNV